MDRAAVDETERQLNELVRARFPGDVMRVALLQYGDDPVVEPGELMIRVLIRVPEGAEGDEAGEHALKAFHQAHRDTLREFRRELEERLPEVRRVEITAEGTEDKPRSGQVLMMRLDGPPMRDRGAGDLTPVMARLGPVDLETLDTLITAGIAANRAEAVRWALARIRERPAYAQLLERVREIDELKAQF
jgi:hypothetical protein